MKTSKTSKAVLIQLVVLFLIFTSCGRSGNIQLSEYPEYKVVMSKFLSEYSITDIKWPNQFYMAKKSDGWHAMVVDMKAEKVIQDDLYWSRKYNRYIETTFEMVIGEVDLADYKTLIEDWQNNYFTSILPFWGYAGWDKDVIDTYKNEKDLSDTLLNALARAYTSYASNLLNKNTGFSSPATRFKLKEGQNALSQKQLQKYRKYMHKCIETYHKLWELNPDFETFVGDIYNVYSNEIMNCFLTLRYYQNEQEAQKELKPGLYDGFTIEMAKRYLSSCDSNAILITNGDMDTYPLIYVQEMEGYRKDVTLININLLTSPRYVSHLYSSISGAQPISFKIPLTFYQNDSNQIIFIYEQINASKIEDILDFVTSTNPRTKLQVSEMYKNYFPTSNLKLKVNTDDLPKYLGVKREDGIDPDSVIYLKLKGRYLQLNHFCFLDILSTNFHSRPICFAITVDNEHFMGLGKYFQYEGIAYKITPFNRGGTSYPNIGFVDTDMQYKKLITNTDFRSVDTKSQKYYELHKKMVGNYRMTYSRLAEKLLDENKNDRAYEVLTYCDNVFDSDKVPHNFTSLTFIECYYRLHQIEEANAIVNDLYLSSKANAENILSQESSPEQDYELRVSLYVLKELADLTGKYIKNSKLAKTIKSDYNNLKE